MLSLSRMFSTLVLALTLLLLRLLIMLMLSLFGDRYIITGCVCCAVAAMTACVVYTNGGICHETLYVFVLLRLFFFVVFCCMCCPI